MAFPERFSNLPEYAFPRLRKLLDAHAPGGEPIAMTIGEPRHPMPGFRRPGAGRASGRIRVVSTQRRHARTAGGDLPAGSAAATASDLAPDRIMALNGTREGLFNAAIALCPETKRGKRPVVLMPNPFYQVYADRRPRRRGRAGLCAGHRRRPAFCRITPRCRPTLLDRAAHRLSLLARQSAGRGGLARLSGSTCWRWPSGMISPLLCR